MHELELLDVSEQYLSGSHMAILSAIVFEYATFLVLGLTIFSVKNNDVRDKMS